MLIFFSVFIIQGIRIQNRWKMKHFFGVLHRLLYICQQIRQIQAYHRKILLLFQCYPSQQKKKFLSYKVANNSYWGGFFQVLIFDSKLDTLPKTYQGGTNYTKIILKLLITSSFNGQQLVFLEN